MLTLQRPPLKHFLPTLPHNGLGVINPLLKRERLGAGEANSACAVTGAAAIASSRLSTSASLGPRAAALLASSVTASFNLKSYLPLKIRASLGHPAINLLLSPVLARIDGVLCLDDLALPHLQPL